MNNPIAAVATNRERTTAIVTTKDESELSVVGFYTAGGVGDRMIVLIPF
jgi:NH3-dependent NAD+ synthetase